MEKKIINFNTFFDDLIDEVKTEYNKVSVKPQDKVEHFASILRSMLNIYDAKNTDYGDSFSDGVKKYGYVSAVTRLHDKFSRVERLVMNGNSKVKEESLKDTLLDLANYSIMFYMEIENGE